MSSVDEFLASLKAQQPLLAGQIDIFLDLFNRKLWHQLTDELDRLFLSATFQAESFDLITFYERFIKEFETRINKLRLAQIARRVSESYGENTQASRVFCERILSIVKSDVQASLYIRTRLASIHMIESDFKTAKKIITEIRDEVEARPDSDPVLHSALARTAMEYHRSQGTPTEYYKNALLFLHYTPKDKLTPLECIAIAFELGIAACVGDDVYNFGELLAHPTIGSLAGSPHDWLYGLLVAFNTGSIAAYHEVTTRHQAILNQQPALVASIKTLEEKIMITALLSVVFSRPSNNRRLTFAEISSVTQQPLDRVEHILMRSMSLGLLRGVIDEVEGCVDISWVKPRVLQPQHLQQLSARLGDWATSVDAALRNMEHQTNELVF